MKVYKYIVFNYFELQERYLSKLKACLSADDRCRQPTEIGFALKVGGGDC